VWRLVHKRIATVQEIDTHWSLVDVMQANLSLDAIEAAEERAQKARR
jgi:hypothetical protein